MATDNPEDVASTPPTSPVSDEDMAVMKANLDAYVSNTSLGQQLAAD